MTRDETLNHLRERILAFATSRGSREVAEDLAQDVLMVLHEKYPQVTELTELVPLSFQILRYKMLDLHRKMLRRGDYVQESIEDRQIADCEGDPSVQAEQKERVTHLIESLEQLGERCRKLFRLKLQGHTFPEIQHIFGERSINTIYTWDSRCRKQLLSLMGGRWQSMPLSGQKKEKHGERIQ